MRTLLIISILLGIVSSGLGQPTTPTPPNDWCAKAIQIQPGETLSYQDNSSATLGHPNELPDMAEITCIQTPENDLWYSFQTEEGYEWYEVVIAMTDCNTPAGLQALLIRSDDCSKDHFIYRGCSNKISTDTIKLFLHEPEPGKKHLIWVDGYDGTNCMFEITLSGKKSLTPDDYRFLRYDYEMGSQADEAAPAPSIRFNNNAAVIRWTGNTLEPVALYLVEQLPEFAATEKENAFGRIVGIIDPNSMVASGEAYYEFEDMITDYRGKNLIRYRVVKVFQDGKRESSPVMQVQPELIETFFVDTPKKGDQAGTITVKYLNHKKGQDFRLKVIDDAGKVVKETTLQKEPVRDGTVTLQMAGYPAGQYIFMMSNGRESFSRAFRWAE